MKFTIALAATAFAANAASLAADAAEPHGWEHKPSFSIGDHYRQPDYQHEYGEELPGADFNRQVYQFNEKNQIWDQNDYEERVKVEAELLVALEALKSSVSYLGYDIHQLDDKISYNRGRIGSNQDDIYANAADVDQTFQRMQGFVHSVQDKCGYAQRDLDTNKDALVLYCQQFAFAPEMNYACASILTCRDTQLPYRYAFSGSYQQPDYSHHQEPHHHDEHYHEPQSSHGIKLNVTGGNVETAGYVDPELAAAAINPHEAVIQVDGKTIVAPLDHIDPSKVELACDDTGCTLIPDDGNPHNDIHPHDIHGHHDHHDHHDPHGHHDHHGHHDSHGHHDNHGHHDGHGHAGYGGTHNIDLPMVGGNTYVDPSTNPELAAAAYDEHQAVIVHGGEAFLAPIESINPDAVELACNQDGCALIKDDGNPHNDVHPHHH